MKKETKIIGGLIGGAMTFLPIAVLAAGIVPLCNNGPCGYSDLIIMANSIIRFLVLDISVPIASIAFVYAGFLYITSAGNEGQISKAHDIFRKVIIGFIIAAGAWLIVHFILASFSVGSQYRSVVQ